NSIILIFLSWGEGIYTYRGSKVDFNHLIFLLNLWLVIATNNRNRQRMNTDFKPTFIILLFIGSIFTIIGIMLVMLFHSKTFGLILLGVGFIIQLINLFLYYKYGRISKESGVI